MKSDHAPRGLTQRDIGDGAAAAQHAHASPPPPGVDGDAFHDVGASGDFQHVGAEGVGGVAGDDDGGLGFVLGACRAASGAACGTPTSTSTTSVASATGTGGGGVGGFDYLVIVVILVVLVVGIGGLLLWMMVV